MRLRVSGDTATWVTLPAPMPKLGTMVVAVVAVATPALVQARYESVLWQAYRMLSRLSYSHGLINEPRVVLRLKLVKLLPPLRERRYWLYT